MTTVSEGLTQDGRPVGDGSFDLDGYLASQVGKSDSSTASTEHSGGAHDASLDSDDAILAGVISDEVVSSRNIADGLTIHDPSAPRTELRETLLARSREVVASPEFNTVREQRDALHSVLGEAESDRAELQARKIFERLNAGDEVGALAAATDMLRDNPGAYETLARGWRDREFEEESQAADLWGEDVDEAQLESFLFDERVRRVAALQNRDEAEEAQFEQTYDFLASNGDESHDRLKTWARERGFATGAEAQAAYRAAAERIEAETGIDPEALMYSDPAMFEGLVRTYDAATREEQVQNVTRAVNQAVLDQDNSVESGLEVLGPMGWQSTRQRPDWSQTDVEGQARRIAARADTPRRESAADVQRDVMDGGSDWRNGLTSGGKPIEADDATGERERFAREQAERRARELQGLSGRI
jgi:hypothetical protein